MRDINRIEPFLDIIEEYWKKQPDFRFGQLISIVDLECDLFYVEDKDFLDSLKQTYSKI